MRNPIEYFQLKRDWRLVSTLNAYFSYNDSGNNDETIFYYLYENGLGKRKCKHESDGKFSGDAAYCIDARTTHPYYLGRIRPWCEGRFDPDIPTYESIKVKEFKDALSGKVT